MKNEDRVKELAGLLADSFAFSAQARLRQPQRVEVPGWANDLVAAVCRPLSDTGQPTHRLMGLVETAAEYIRDGYGVADWGADVNTADLYKWLREADAHIGLLDCALQETLSWGGKSYEDNRLTGALQYAQIQQWQQVFYAVQARLEAIADESSE